VYKREWEGDYWVDCRFLPALHEDSARSNQHPATGATPA